MAIAKTELVNISSDLHNLDSVLERFVDLKCFHPVLSSQIVDCVHGLTSFTSDNPCNVILNELIEIEKEFEFAIPLVEVTTIDYSLDKMNDYVSTTHQKLKSLVNQKKDTLELIRKYEDALIQVKNIESLDISLDDVFSCDYVYARVGRLPTDSVEKLRFYRSRPFIFKSFSVDKDYSWCMYFTTNEYEREVDNIFSSLFFERIHIPDFVHGTPVDAKLTLAKEIEVASSQLDKIQVSINDALEDSDHDLSVIMAELLFLNKIYEAKKYVVGLGDKFTINGFIEPKDEMVIKDKFKDLEDIEIQIRPADSDKRLKTPTKLKNRWFSRPFEMFVEMYGLPSYGDIDPTPFVAITYSLLFGIMFADLGQGILLSLIGLILFKWKKLKLGEIAIRIGLSSAFFGLLFGSFFGNEEILTPFYTKILGLAGKPIEVMNSDFTMTLIIIAVLLGSLLIVMSISINIYINFKKRRIPEMFFSHNGVSGLLFYLFVFGGLVLKLKFGVNIFSWLTISLFVGIPLLLIFFKEPLERKIHGGRLFPSGFGGFFVEGFFELFEVLLSYITNTMSFMRVGGFVIAHAGMMLVVYSLMQMGSSVISTSIIFVVGNLFVMALESMIVGIQVLRLEFFEMFSRFYEGDGIPFKILQ
ncbi:MAG: V-type ATPase 116kDa subunit family protein [Candidatus Izemoplasmatales bacterium]|nr:V-type ATPase 116kDa subunit family protein [Candidatus Izemoplasmatales bacterium]